MAEDLALEAAERILAAAKKKAAQLTTKMDIAVVDAGGNHNPEDLYLGSSIATEG